MIKINKNFFCKRDPYCWHLYHIIKSKDKDGNETEKTRITYHGTLEQICEVVIDRSCGNCNDIVEIHNLLSNAIKALTKKVEKKVS